jgi:hypothetical protein
MIWLHTVTIHTTWQTTLKYTQLVDLIPEILGYTTPTLYPLNKWSVPCTFSRKLPRRVTSRPEIEISDKRLAFSRQTSSIEPSYKTGPKQVKISISQKVQGFLKQIRVQHVALTARRPKHPCLVWCNLIFLYETFSRLIPRDSNKGHHITLFKIQSH